MRIIHVLNPAKWKKGKYLHHADSNFHVVLEFIKTLQPAHHFVLFPNEPSEPPEIDANLNVTFIPITYQSSPLRNRFHFDMKGFLQNFDFHCNDVDLIINHQPEITANIHAALAERRYSNQVKFWSVFHWYDVRTSGRSVDSITSFVIRQLEAVTLSERIFVHSPHALQYLKGDLRFESRKPVPNTFASLVDEKVTFMPLPSWFPSGAAPIESCHDTIVWNHRQTDTTGWEKFKLWMSESQMRNVVVTGSIPKEDYIKIVKTARCSVCFAQNENTWNMAILDALSAGVPTIVIRNSMFENMLGKDYPYYVSTKQEFQSTLECLMQGQPKRLESKWIGMSDYFRGVLRQNILDAAKSFTTFLSDHSRFSKWTEHWTHEILKQDGSASKKAIVEATQPNLRLNSAWVNTRRNILCDYFAAWPQLPVSGTIDDVRSLETLYIIPSAVQEPAAKRAKVNLA